MLITAWFAWCVCVSAIFVLHALDTYGARSVLHKGLGACFLKASGLITQEIYFAVRDLSRKRYISLFFARDRRGVRSVLGEGLWNCFPRSHNRHIWGGFARETRGVS